MCVNSDQEHKCRGSVEEEKDRIFFYGKDLQNRHCCKSWVLSSLGLASVAQEFEMALRMAPLQIKDSRRFGRENQGPIHTGREHANSRANPLVLLACIVNTPIHDSRSICFRCI